MGSRYGLNNIILFSVILVTKFHYLAKVSGIKKLTMLVKAALEKMGAELKGWQETLQTSVSRS